MKATKQWVGFLALSSLFISASAVAGDSTGLAQTLPADRGGSKVSAYYPDQSTVPSVTSGATGAQYYDNLPNCPGDPTSSSAPSAPVCPDINNNWTVDVPGTSISPGKSPSKTDATLQRYCPDVCQTNRKVVTGSPITNGSTTYTPVTSTTPAICPPGYVQIGASTSGPDIQYNSSVGTPVRVTNEAEYRSLLSRGYTCREESGPPLIQAYCDYNTDIFNNANTNNCDSSTVGTPQIFVYAGLPVYGILKTCPEYTAENIAAGTVGCYVPGVSKCKYSKGLNTTTGLCQNPYSTSFINTYQYIQCTPPAGYYYTDNTVPTKLACARVKSVWQKRH